MLDLKLWEMVVLLRDSLISISNTFLELITQPILSVLIFPKKWTIFGFNISEQISKLLVSNDFLTFSLLDVLIGGGLTTILGLIIAKKLIPFF